MFRLITATICALATLLLLEGRSSAISDDTLYKKAQEHLRKGEKEIAFLTFRDITHTYPNSPYLDESLYHIIKYYMGSNNFFEASRLLKKHLDKFPESQHREQILKYACQIRVKATIKKAEQAFNRNNYELAMFYYSEALKTDPDNKEAKRQIEQIDRILIHSNYLRSQLEKEKKRIESESREIARAMASVEKQRKLAELLKQEAEIMDQQTRQEYDKLLSEAEDQRDELKQRVERLMSDLEIWKQRAKKLEAKILAEPDITGLKLVAETENLPRIIFEGGSTSKGLTENEKLAEELLQQKSPSVVLVAETRDEYKNLRQAEFVVSVDLKEKWPPDCQLKLRVDFFNLLSDNTPTRIARPKIIYYSISDMDQVDEQHLSYRKKVMIAVDKKQFQKYEVTAFFVRQKSDY